MPDKLSTKVGHALTKGLGIKHQYPDSGTSGQGGESTFSSGTADTYMEPEPTTAEWIAEYVPSLQDVGHFFYNMFPFLKWIGRYNLQWFIGDLVAGKSACSPWLYFVLI
jgi:solute carrier family 26 (sodium-independent sulfate anion transporter), member 11